MEAFVAMGSVLNVIINIAVQDWVAAGGWLVAALGYTQLWLNKQ